MARLRFRSHPEEDFPMAPMIDMVFLLLVFFMCVSTLAQAERQVEVALPRSEESVVPEDLSGRGIVTLTADGRIHLGMEEVTPAELTRRLRATLGREPSLRVQVRADAATPFRETRRVLRACAEAGAAEVIYATIQR